jgi:uncharacterized coiled-coil DUF342 family protein
MSVKEAVLSALKELVLPELAAINKEQAEVKLSLAANSQRLDDVGKRLDDMNAHLVDQSRRIDALREELSTRIDNTNKRLDQLYEVIVRRDEHQQLAARVERLENEMADLKKRLAA